MNKKAFTLVEILIVVAIIAALVAITVPNIIRSRINANESAAQANLKTICTAMETYASSNRGDYAEDIDNLIDAIPPYLTGIFTGQPIVSGYTYSYQLNINGYVVTTTPAIPNRTGINTYEVRTGCALRNLGDGSEPPPPPPPPEGLGEEVDDIIDDIIGSGGSFDGG